MLDIILYQNYQLLSMIILSAIIIQSCIDYSRQTSPKKNKEELFLELLDVLTPYSDTISISNGKIFFTKEDWGFDVSIIHGKYISIEQSDASYTHYLSRMNGEVNRRLIELPSKIKETVIKAFPDASNIYFFNSDFYNVFTLHFKYQRKHYCIKVNRNYQGCCRLV